MAFPPRTWAALEIPTAAQMNAELRDNLNLLTPIPLTITTTGSQAALALPSGRNNLLIFANNATLLTLQGIAAGYDGQELTIWSIGAGQVDLSTQDPAAAAAARIVTGLTAATSKISLAPGSGRGVLKYDATTARWRVLVHEQGASITRTFAAGNYTASAGTWTVAGASTDSYILRGRLLTFSFVVSGTTSGTPITVSIAVPGGFTVAAVFDGAYIISNNGAGVAEAGYSATAAAGTVVNLQRLGNVNFNAGTVAVLGQVTVEVQ